MGGKGSGRPSGTSNHAIVEDHYSLDVRYLKQHRLIDPGTSYLISWRRGKSVIGTIRITGHDERITLDYRARRAGSAWKTFRVPIALLSTACHLGGERVWFQCPNPACGRRVAILYGAQGFLCRHCLDLRYRSQRESDWERIVSKADRIREKLEWAPGILRMSGREKPKGMHWVTFDQLVGRHDQLVADAVAALSA